MSEPTPYPTLEAIGLGRQLAEMERICAMSAAGKHAGECILEDGSRHHLTKAMRHHYAGTHGDRDEESHALHLVHAAVRLLMAAACLEAGT